MSATDATCFEPKSAVDVFKRGVAECVRAGFAAWVTVFAILLAPTALVVAGQYLTWSTGAGELLASMQKGTFNPQTLDIGELMRAVLIALCAGMVPGLVSLVAQYASGVAVARMVASRALGRPFGPAEAWDFVLGRAWQIIGGALALLAILIAGSVAGEIPGMIIGAVIGSASGGFKPGAPPPAAMRIAPVVTMLPVLLALAAYLVPMMAVTGVENRGGFTALSRSFRLVSGRFKHVLGVLVLTGLAFMLPSAAAGIVSQTDLAAQLRVTFGAANGMLLLNGISSGLSLITSPFMCAIAAVIYFDLRSRQRDERFTAYELALDVGGELPEGAEAPSSDVSGMSQDSPARPSDII